ncbi:hypothetical protein CKM354_000427500 [Cercospora kikuchii]|uniref:F-box domain-containing protein n=1 Tax=Cercospora kikuchii TaxID=84275 RepID=A0A9P3CIA9_9PEZI|nr:uncharacterized protein CKM354_000427500 [Cercospora kikuchii]GIZ40955.1 hypothetical protein CKM354_000427500 [Cercospora kikuchii]
MAYDASTSASNADDILRACAYHRIDYELATIWCPAREHASVKASLSSVFREPTVSLGELDRLPLELMNTICLDLDIETLFALRQVNLRARQIVTSLSEYKVVAAHALNCLCTLLRTRSAQWVTLSDFYQLLCQQSCSRCEESYGGFVHFVNWNRCCFKCVQSFENQMTTAETAKRQLSAKSFTSLRNMRTLPGAYSMGKTHFQERFDIVPAEPALTTLHAEGVKKGIGLAKVPLYYSIDYMACCAIPYYDPKDKSVQNGVSCVGCRVLVEEKLRLGQFDQMVYDRRDIVYSKQAFLEHFKECDKAQDLWKSSDFGRGEPER